MNPLVFLPLLAVAASAGVLAGHSATVLSAGPLVHHQVIQQQVVQVPVTKTIHYQNTPVVTGYTTQVIKPALAAAPAVALAAPATVAVQHAAVAAPAPVQVATVRAAQAGDFQNIVTKQQVLAPVRTHTQITPTQTKIVPEVTVRKVIQEVPVAQPVAVHTPVIQKVALHAAPIALHHGIQTLQPLNLQHVQTIQTVQAAPAQNNAENNDAKIIQAE